MPSASIKQRQPSASHPRRHRYYHKYSFSILCVLSLPLITIASAFGVGSLPIVRSTVSNRPTSRTAQRQTMASPEQQTPNAAEESAPINDRPRCCPKHRPLDILLNVRTDDPSITVTPKRKDYLSWDDYFMAAAVLSSKRSKDPIKPSGACIVDPENRIVGIGYNGFPRGCDDAYLPWTSSCDADETPWLHTKDPFVCHAVANAVLNKCSDDVAGCTLYVMHFPCSDCTKMIIQCRIRHVVVLANPDGKDVECCASNPRASESAAADDDDDGDDDEMTASQIMMHLAGVSIRYYRPSSASVVLDFGPALPPVEDEIDDGRGRDNGHANDCKITTAISTNTTTATTTTTAATAAKEIPDDVLALLKNELNYTPPQPASANRTATHISWQDYFMSMAFLTARRSKDPNTQVGACLVDDDKRIVGLGYNGFPRGCSDDILPWARSNDAANQLHNKYLFVCHAEVNAIMNKGSANLQGTTLYVALFPCQNCAKVIIQAGIRKVIYMNDQYHDTDGCRASRAMFRLANVEMQRYVPRMHSLTLDF